MRKFYLLFFFLYFSLNFLIAQPGNDLCEDAFVVPELSNWCSNPGAYSTREATASTFESEECFAENGNDVWFQFIAGATEVTINIFGDTPTSSGGTLRQPEVSLLTATDCSDFRVLRCETDEDNNNAVQLIRGGLVVGSLHYIRVQGRGNTGTFQLCINNYNPPAEAGSDAPTAGVLCDKSSFTFEKLSGGGTNRDEADNTCLDQDKDGTDLGDSESSSTWFTWTAETSGPLTFTLFPLQEDDDIDFALYELPNGINDFSNKRLLRCMATACTGPTGLNMTSTDTQEDINCDRGEDGFLRFLDMVQGVSYALLINNFSNSGNGITIEFGQEPGDGIFQGPNADFTTDEPDNQVCVGEDVAFDDISAFPNGNITSWNWTFGVDATPNVAIGPGPHSVTYSSAGIKSIVLSIETDLGCILTKISNFTVLDETAISPTLTPPDCGGGMDGQIELEVAGGIGPYEYSWDGSPFTLNDNTRNNLSEGDFVVQVRDGEGCIQQDTIELREPGPALNSEVEQAIPPSCSGFNDGQLVITATDGTAPYQFDFGNGLSTDNRSGNIPAGVYPVYVVDARGCDSDFLIAIEDPSELELQVDAFDISCSGQQDGNAMAFASGGHGEYLFEWSSGAMGENVQGLGAGDYVISVTDKFGCEVTAPFTIVEPISLQIQSITPGNATCFGTPDGTISVLSDGGVPPYQYSINGGDFQSEAIFNTLFAGSYTVTIRDAEGCSIQSESITIDQPAEIQVDAGPDQTVNLGETTILSANTIVNPVEYFWSGPDSIGEPNNRSVEVLPSRSNHFRVVIQDETGCTATDSLLVQVIINRPVYIPDAFSPNGDGTNQTFTIYGGAAVTRIQLLQIYSRWGDLLYEAKNFLPGDESIGWSGTFNGKVLNPGVFTFLTKVEFLDGVVETYSGDLTLVR